MIQFVMKGGYWTRKSLEEFSRKTGCRISPIIQISKFEDGLYYLHDGNHRAVATWLGGRDYFIPDEYKITYWTYDQYLEVNFANGWFTPFDPRIEVRHPDIHDWKESVKTRLQTSGKLEIEALHSHVLDSKLLYCAPRTMNLLPELARKVADERETHFSGEHAGDCLVLSDVPGCGQAVSGILGT